MRVEKVGTLTRSFELLGDKIGENSRLALDTAGAVVLQPIAMLLGPGAKTEREKNTKKYQVMRQPVSGALKLILTFAISIPFGKRLSKLALSNHFSSYLRSHFYINTAKVKNFHEFVQKTGMTSMSNKQAKKITEVIRISNRLKELHDSLIIQEVAIDTYLLKTSKLITAKDRLYTTINKINYLKNQPHLLKQDKNLNKLIGQYDSIILKLGKLKDGTTKDLRKIIFSDTYQNHQIEKCKKVLIIEPTKSYEGFQQLLQWGITLFMQPFVAYAINLAFPPFVELISPRLVQTVRGYNP